MRVCLTRNARDEPQDSRPSPLQAPGGPSVEAPALTHASCWRDSAQLKQHRPVQPVHRVYHSIERGMQVASAFRMSGRLLKRSEKCIHTYIHTYIYIYICMVVDHDPVLSRGPPPLLVQAFVAAGCFKPIVVDFSQL